MARWGHQRGTLRGQGHESIAQRSASSVPAWRGDAAAIIPTAAFVYYYLWKVCLAAPNYLNDIQARTACSDYFVPF